MTLAAPGPFFFRHSRESGNPASLFEVAEEKKSWIPAFAGMTLWGVL